MKLRYLISKSNEISDDLYKLKEQKLKAYRITSGDIFVVDEEEFNSKAIADLIKTKEFIVIGDFYERIPPYRFIEKLKFWKWIKKKHLYKIEVNLKDE